MSQRIEKDIRTIRLLTNFPGQEDNGLFEKLITPVPLLIGVCKSPGSRYSLGVKL